MKKETEWEARKRCGEKPFEKESWEKKFNKILGEEMQGILIMNSKQKFDMCERLLNDKGKIKSFIRRLLKEKDELIEDLEEEVERLERREP